jgi:hypothetical protein
VFLTALYALEKLARVEPGERVLIHAAAGGRRSSRRSRSRGRLGAEIYATAGDDAKRDYLRALGIRHVFDSRSLSFVDGVREATGGEGRRRRAERARPARSSGEPRAVAAAGTLHRDRQARPRRRVPRSTCRRSCAISRSARSTSARSSMRATRC